MAISRRTFLASKMDKDLDERLLQDGQYRDALNIRLANSESSNVGAIEKSLSNKIVSELAIGDTVKTIGSASDEFEEKIYLLLKSELGCYIVEYDVNTETTVFVAKDTRVVNVLNFSEDFLITGINIVIDSDNGNRLLLFTDGNTQPKCVNIERAKTYAENGFTEEMILVIKKPPLDAPTVALSLTINEENNIEEKFVSFSYRYKYLDGEFSALAPFSEYAFDPKAFDYDYSTGINESMINAHNKVDVTVNTGSLLITDIQIVFKESGSNALYLIENYNKAEQGWVLPNDSVTISFTNNKIYKVLAEKELFRIYDNVPLDAKAQDIIDNMLVYGNYTENRDIADANGTKINIDLTAEQVSTDIVSGVATRSLKSNRDYEVGISYLDDYGRLTTPLTSENNTIYIPNSDSIKQNKIKVSIANKAPDFAKYYRFFIKQTKGDYETIAPTLFYEDGNYRWVKLEGADKDKVKEGDFLVIKSDSQSVTGDLVTTKVLEVKYQDKNFLQPEDVTNKITERAGLYFKIKPKNFRLDVDDFENFELTTYHNSRDRYNDCLTNSSENTGLAYYYGDSGLDDMISGGIPTLLTNIDKHFVVQISSLGDGITTFNQFRWNVDGGSFGAETVITVGTPQLLSDGVTVTFASNTGHTITDEWSIYARGTLKSNGLYAYGFFRTVGDKYLTMTESEHTIEDEIIEIGANIVLTYDEYGAGSTFFELSLISDGKYANIQEWYYGDNVGQKIIDKIPTFNLARIYFMRGIIRQDNDGNANYLDYNADGYTTMIMQSQLAQPTNVSFNQIVKISAKTTLFQTNGTTRLIFETKPKDYNSDIFYEIGKTYAIDANHNHLGYDIGDTNQSTGVSAILNLDVFNCYSWGNGHESYKIKDGFNAKTLNFDTRPSTPIENYRQNKRIASITYSQPYEQSTNYNGLNEFNLSLINFYDLDDKYGAIQKIVSWNNDLDIFQEDKVHKLLYLKAMLFNADGTSNLEKSTKVFDGVIPYVGEFGISTKPESLVIYGNNIYWVDPKRGVVLRKGQSGIEIISNFGMQSWFRDIFKTSLGAILGGYDPYFGQYIISLGGYTLTFDEKVKGWTSFHSYLPDSIIRVNNRLFTVKNGNTYIHNETLNGYNEFYGQQYSSSVQTIFNDANFEDSIFKNIILESDLPWRIVLATNYTNGNIPKTEFTKRETRYFASIRGNENTSDLRGVTQGIGNIVGVSGTTITFASVTNITSAGDTLYQINGVTKEPLGVITGISNNQITIDAIVIAPIIGNFAYSKSDSRVNGVSMRGYYLSATLIDDSNTANELYAVSSNMVQSNLSVR